MKSYFLLSLSVLFLSACSLKSSPPAQSTSSPSPTVTTSPVTISLEEVSRHTTPGDCWLAIEGKVYNVSGFGDGAHPGKKAIYQGCGTDATQLFNTRPMGSGTPHSNQARNKLPNFYIGDLQK